MSTENKKPAENDKYPELDMAAKAYALMPDDNNKHEVIKAGLRLVNYFVRIYGGNRDNDDLRQAGLEGLLKALKGFKPEYGASFATYAGHCIMGGMRHFLRKETSYYKPGTIKDVQYRVENFIENHMKETGETPDISLIAKKLNIREESVSEVMRAGLVSIDEIELSRIKSHHYESFTLPIEDRIAMQLALKKLSDMQRKVIEMLFYRGMTQQQAAKELGINQRKVSRIRSDSLEELKSYFTRA